MMWYRTSIMTLAAAVDLGSNTLRLLIAEAEPGACSKLTPVLLERRITRLSQNLVPGRPLFGPAKARTLAALAEFGRLVASHRVEKVFGGATAAVRLAGDGDEFLDQVAARTGLRLRKIDGREEARLTALGVLVGLESGNRPWPGPWLVPWLVVDPGGRSTELIPIEEGRPGTGLSLEMGVVELTERFVRRAPAEPKEMASLTAEVRLRLKAALSFYRPRPGLRLAGTAGTVTTIAAMLAGMRVYDPEAITGRVIGLAEMDRLQAGLEGLTLDQRRELPGLEAGREDVILAGLVVVRELVRVYGLREMVVVDSGLLEGHIIDGLGLARVEGNGCFNGPE